MWKADYKDEKKPMDLLLVCGLNNILKGDDTSTILFKYERFYDKVVTQGEKREGGNKNTFAVATLFYPPQLCWFPKNGTPPSPNYKNHLEFMKHLNEMIMKMNQRIFEEQSHIYKEPNYGWMAGDKSSSTWSTGTAPRSVGPRATTSSGCSSRPLKSRSLSLNEQTF